MSINREMDTQPHIPVFSKKKQNQPDLLPVRERPTQVWQRPLPEPEPSSQPRRSYRFFKWVETLVILLFLVISVSLATIGVLILYQVDWILPGVSVSGVAVGDRTQADAVVALQSAWQNKPILVEAEEQRLAVLPADLGLVLDAEATAVFAQEQGRTWESWQTFLQHNGRFEVDPVWQYDQAQALAGLEALSGEFAMSPVEAQLVWENGRFVAKPGQPGQELDVVASGMVLGEQMAQVIDEGRFELVTQPVLPTVIDLSAAAVEANMLLSAPLNVEAYDPVKNETFSQAIPPEIWGTWLNFETANEKFVWTLDEHDLVDYLDTINLGNSRFVESGEWETTVTQAIINKDPKVTLRVYHRPQIHIVQFGETLASIGRNYGIPYPWIQQANPGMDALSVGQQITIPPLDKMLPLPVVPNKRIVVSIAQQKAWIYENDNIKWEWPVSTGIASSPTAPGIFQIQSHEPNAYAGNWDLWMPSFMGIYRPVPTSDFMNGFHGFPTRGGSNLLWTGDLGHPVTYGCILLSSENAQLLYEWAEAGVVVEIQS